ncbi:tRNA pseudouridine synthase-like 1 [Halotydeus destructor]|nr:tRNA pseudouridine synthase-like 1 [Halotydeus destructor]
MTASGTKRFLLYLSYLGTQSTRSIKRQSINVGHHWASRQLFRTLDARLSSKVDGLKFVGVATKTERGVHAPGNAATIDFIPKSNDVDSEYIQAMVNSGHLKLYLDYTISRVQEVPLSFDCVNHATDREFVYRLIIPKSSVSAAAGYESLLPIGELGRCCYMVEPKKLDFDLQLANSLATKLKGTHDFSSFCHDTPTVSKTRNIEDFEVNKLDLEAHEEFDPLYKNVNIYEFYVRGRSFVSHQIPNMIGSITAAATGLMPPSNFQELLDNPSPINPNRFALTLPTSGLYLIMTHYDEKDLKFDEIRPAQPPETEDFDIVDEALNKADKEDKELAELT